MNFAAFLRFAGLEHIRTSVGYPQANGKIERYHGTIQRECIARISMVDLDDARKQVGKFIDYYNAERLHSSLFFLTPEDFLFNRVDAKLKERNKKLLNAKSLRMKVHENV